MTFFWSNIQDIFLTITTTLTLNICVWKLNRGLRRQIDAICFQSVISQLKFQDKSPNYSCGDKKRIRREALHTCPYTHTVHLHHTQHTHTPCPVWGHFALHSSTSIFHLHNREGAAERRKALQEIIKDPAGMQQHSSRRPILSNRSNESCPSDH